MCISDPHIIYNRSVGILNMLANILLIDKLIENLVIVSTIWEHKKKICKTLK